MWFERNVMYSVCIYDLSVLAVSRMGFQKKKYLDRGVSFLDFWNFFNFAKPLKSTSITFVSPRNSTRSSGRPAHKTNLFTLNSELSSTTECRVFI